MDSITHIVLAGAIAQSFFRRPLGKAAFFIAGVAATLPDLDVFIRTGNELNNHLLHRYFSHALLVAPLLAGLTTAAFMLRKSLRPHAALVYLLALIAVFSHILLDACTSYGTLLLWPFSELRSGWDLIAVVDVTFTGLLIIGVFLAWRKQSPLPARLALAAAFLYLGLATIQHQRALSAQQQLIASRHQSNVTVPRALPQVGSILNFRSLYIQDGRIHVDALRIPMLGRAQVREGPAIDCVVAQDLKPFPPSEAMTRDFDRMQWFADGYLARSPEDPHILADMRYTATPDGFDAIWGLRLEETPDPQWHTFASRRNISRLWKEIIRPKGYAPLGTATP